MEDVAHSIEMGEHPIPYGIEFLFFSFEGFNKEVVVGLKPVETLGDHILCRAHTFRERTLRTGLASSNEGIKQQFGFWRYLCVSVKKSNPPEDIIR